MTFLCNECGKNSDESKFYKFYRKVKNKCKDCFNKKLKCELCGKFFIKKLFTSHNEREHQPSEPKPNNNETVFPEKQNQVSNLSVSAYDKHRHVIVDPSNVGKTYYILKILAQIGKKRPIFIKTRSPTQYQNYKTSFDIKPKDTYKGSVVIFEDMLVTQNSSQIDEFFTRGDMKI